MTDTTDTIVVGAGVVGLAIARAMALAGDDVVIIEAEDAIGTGLSARNSEVIHAGLYYPEGTLKAQLCRPGRDALYAFCDSHGIAHKRIGKLVVATADDELDALADVKTKAEACGVNDLEPLDPDQVRAMEPAVKCSGALLSPSTGIVDSHGYMLALQGDAESSGAVLALSSPLEGGSIGKDGITVRVGGAEPMTLTCRRFINSAGLGAQAVATAIEGLPADSIPPLFYAKGNYFTLSGKRPFQKMIYPVPVQGGLGTHSTLDLAGQTKFGPDVEWVDSPDYTVDPARADMFYRAIRRYWPDLPDGALQPGYVGVRPKLVPEGTPRGDWDIRGPEHHGIDGLVNLFGIESPGLTSSLAIADYVSGLLR
ncbi:MAG: NAD(P)/FAD-dependent oxidoreductase [Rhodospirillales bacterium]|nr:NAD(P)/FAD-dependent oxidoreductase [Alphaproteobacteria bacterium]MBL6947304.1 NAD(P)/FAD-dependent oxidoreductase [Rhodospirillales bacterium]